MPNLTLGRCVGLIGGLGVGAAIHYYRELARMHAARGRVLNLVMVHADNQAVREAIEAGDKRGLASYLADLTGRLKPPAPSSALFPPWRRTSRSPN